MKSFIILFATFSFFFHCVAAIEDHQYKSNDCDCIEYSCGCCTRLNLFNNYIDANVCAEFSYMPDEYGIQAEVKYNNKTVLKEIISPRNPPSICVFHVDKLQLKLCLRFYKLDVSLDVSDGYFTGCAKIEMRLFHFLHWNDQQLGCFKLDTPFDDDIDIDLAYLKNLVKNSAPRVTLL